jgi:hypothetical protein
MLSTRQQLLEIWKWYETLRLYLTNLTFLESELVENMHINYVVIILNFLVALLYRLIDLKKSGYYKIIPEFFLLFAPVFEYDQYDSFQFYGSIC